jgi:cell division protein FtsB
MKYLTPLVLAVFVYSILSITLGARGFSAYSQMQDELGREQDNLETLQQQNQQLDSKMKALLYDKDTITAYARELGYIEPGQKFVRVVGTAGVSSLHYNMGRVVRAVKPASLSNDSIRNISLGFAFALYISIALAEILRRQDKVHVEERRPAVEEIRAFLNAQNQGI